MNVVFLSHTARTGVFRVGSHHLARELASRGHDVLHASTPVTLGHLARIRDENVRRRLRLALGRPRRDDDGVVHVVARAPLPLGLPDGPVGRAVRSACGRLLAATAAASGMRRVDVVLIDQPLFADSLDPLDAGRVVYRPTDVHVGGPLARLERRLLGRVDGVVATSEFVLDDMDPPARSLPHLTLENGVEFARFATTDRTTGTGSVYLGAIDDRFGWDALRAMAEQSPDEPVRLAGPVAAPPPSLPRNVQLLGPVQYADAPALLRSAAVGLLPLSGEEINQGRSPMKFYEYLAAGLRVVATWTPTLAARPAPNVALYRTPAEAAQQLRAQLAARRPNFEGVEYAREFDWSRRAARLETYLAALGN